MKGHSVIFLVFLAITCVCVNGQGEGCDPYMSYPDHTMCIYYDDACPTGDLKRSGELTCQEKFDVVNEHNRLRNQVAIGNVTGQPAAENMAEMVWDEELATIAQRWADQCTFGHDQNRNVDRFYVGQNAYAWSRSPIYTDYSANFVSACGSWFSENESFPPENIEPYVSSAGHYTQMVWADSWALGCGFVAFDKGGWTNKYYFCNYGPGGNIIGGSMYKVGAGRNCAAYPDLTDSPRWPGLCEVANTNPPGNGCKAEDYTPKHTASRVLTYDKNVQIKTLVFPASFFENRKN